MTNYVDIHSHILPMVDDGASSAEETVRMMEQAYDEGIRTIIATPHCGIRNPEYDVKEGERICGILNNYLIKREENPQNGDKPLTGLRIELGNELIYSTGIAEDLKSGKYKTLAGTDYVLVEFYPGSDFATLEACAREFSMYGYRPIYAHVERYKCLQADYSKVEALKSYGVLMQVNCDSLLSAPEDSKSVTSKTLFNITRPLRPGASTQVSYRETAWDLLKNGMIEFIASDAHGCKYRKPLMETALSNIRSYLGEEAADMLVANARNILK